MYTRIVQCLTFPLVTVYAPFMCSAVKVVCILLKMSWVSLILKMMFLLCFFVVVVFFTCSALPVLLPSPVLLLLLLPPCPLKELNKTSKVFLFYLPYLLEVTQQRTMGDFSLCTLATDSFLTHTHADTEHTNTHISEKQHEVRKSGIKDFKTV